MIILSEDSLGCAYSIDSEGTLFFTPQYTDSTINIHDWIEVDHLSLLGEDDNVRSIIDTIHEQLITLSKSIGEYYQP